MTMTEDIESRSKLFKWMVFLFKYGMITILAVVMCFFAMDKIIMPLYVGHGNDVEMPDVTQRDYAEAIVILHTAGFRVVKESKYDPYARPGIVISQKPIPFNIVKEGRTINLTVSLGRQKVLMPNIMGISARDAELKLLESGLKPGEVDYSPSSFPEGTVISQQFENPMELEKGTKVSFAVSTGAEKENVKMPNTVNKSISVAINMVRKLGLIVGQSFARVQNDLLPNTVLVQMPNAGQTVSPGDTVLFIISKIDTSNTGGLSKSFKKRDR